MYARRNTNLATEIISLTLCVLQPRENRMQKMIQRLYHHEQKKHSNSVDNM